MSVLRLDARSVQTQGCGIATSAVEPQMVLAKMDFGKYTEMSEEEREKIIPMDGFTSIRRSIEHMQDYSAEGYQRGALSEALRRKEFFIRLQEKMESENVPYEPW